MSYAKEQAHTVFRNPVREKREKEKKLHGSVSSVSFPYEDINMRCSRKITSTKKDNRSANIS